jgi:DNA-binding MarR family transcriptional regulator
MAVRSTLLEPSSLDELFLFRLTRLLAVAGAPIIRLCEGGYNITRREWRLIAALAQSGPVLSSTLAQRVHLERGRTSKAVSDLIGKGLVTRTPRPDDRRKVDIALTDGGRSIYESLFPIVVQLNKDLLAVLSRSEIDELDYALGRIQERADKVFANAVLPKANRRHPTRHAN